MGALWCRALPSELGVSILRFLEEGSGEGLEMLLRCLELLRHSPWAEPLRTKWICGTNSSSGDIEN